MAVTNGYVQYRARTTQDIAGTKTSIGWIKKTSGKMLGLGQELLDGGAVIRARTDRNILWARVRDKTVHAVSVYLDLQTNIYRCTCSSSEAVCQHVVAALLYTSKNLPEMIRYEYNFGPIIDHLLEGISNEEVRDLVVRKINDYAVIYYDSAEKEMLSPVVQKIKDDIKKVDDLTEQETRSLAVRKIAYDIGAFLRILHIMGEKEINSRTECYSKIEKMFKKLCEETYDTTVWSSPNMDFGKFFQRARRYVRQEKYHWAACTYQGISEAIANNMDLIDDSDGYYAKRFQKSIRDMAKFVNLADQGHPRKRQYISYLHEMFIRNDPDYFNGFYDEVIRTVCTTKNDLEYWRGLHEPLVPDHVPDIDDFDKYYWAAIMIEMQEHILRKLCDPSLEDFYKKHYTAVPGICQAYVRWLASHNPDKAHQIAKEGRDIFPRKKITVPKIR